jgi:hypothetical protein
MSSQPEHTSLESEWTETIDEAVAVLAQETAAQAEQAGIEAGAPAEDVPGRPELGDKLRKELVEELVQAAAAVWRTGIPQFLLFGVLPKLIKWWWIKRRAHRGEERGRGDDVPARHLLEIDGRFVASVQSASQGRASRSTVRELSDVRKEYAVLLDADLPSYLAAPTRRSLASAAESLAGAYASRGETEAAAREFLAAEEAWEQVGDEEAANRCRTSRAELR